VPAIQIDDLTRAYGDVTAVDELSLTVAEGELFGLLGPNGAGKTTLFNCITGALSATEGTVWFRGEDITDIPSHERVRRGLGRSFQITNVFGGLAVRENIRLAAQSIFGERISGRDAMFRDKNSFGDVSARTDEVLDRIGLAAHADERAETLAYGDQRRLEIGIVLATDPELVLLDEPTAGMSSEETRATMDLIEDVLAERSLLLIEHDIDLVMRVSDRITVLTRGEVLAEGAPTAIAEDDDVRDAYLGGVRQ